MHTNTIEHETWGLVEIDFAAGAASQQAEQSAEKNFAGNTRTGQTAQKPKPGNCPVSSKSKILAKISTRSLCPRYYEGQGSKP
jgi:hypothetical protein